MEFSAVIYSSNLKDVSLTDFTVTFSLCYIRIHMPSEEIFITGLYMFWLTISSERSSQEQQQNHSRLMNLHVLVNNHPHSYEQIPENADEIGSKHKFRLHYCLSLPLEFLLRTCETFTCKLTHKLWKTNLPQRNIFSEYVAFYTYYSMLSKTSFFQIFPLKKNCLLYIYQTLLSKAIYSAFRLNNFYQYVCSLGIEPANFCAVDAILYH